MKYLLIVILLIGCGDRLSYPITIKSKTSINKSCLYEIGMFGKDPNFYAPCYTFDVGDTLK